MVKEKCPACGCDWLRSAVIHQPRRNSIYYKKCWGCGKMFTRNLMFELKEVRKIKKRSKGK